MPKRTDLQYQKLLEDVCGDSCCRAGEYCFLKLIVMEIGLAPRVILQIKAVEKFKFEESAGEGHDIGTQEAWRRWTDGDNSWSEAFALAYEKFPEYSFDKLWKEISKIKKEKP